ncbi:ABC transporter ATP-binding protein [Nitrospina gracilis]|uniref:ABC transporter ATP-binding protein n=1 Tax=Nitrospina gracilis TaxID=35801 RepID=UPI001F49000C|nr:ABC transporter ATP-binding protein [Nitrospina gracilis]MCF8720198.1 ABC-type sugar transport system ATPase subunit [Nitrospina gracilis Nb-211]
MHAIRLEDITHGFGGRPVLDGIDLGVEKGEFFIILGASGGGKTTLLNLLAGLQFPDRGRVWFEGCDVTLKDVRERNVAYVFQDYALYPHMTVEENIRFPLENMKWPKADMMEKVAKTIERLQLTDVREKIPAHLSGGQKQRVAIGRALVRDPAVFLFDEPLSNLDPRLRDHLQMELKQLHRQLRKTFVYVTHDAHSAMVLGDRVGFLDGGRIRQVGPPATLYREPETLEIARFFGFPPLNVLAPEGMNELFRQPAPDNVARAGLRPEHVIVNPDSRGSYTILWTQVLGDRTFAAVEVAGAPLCGVCEGSDMKEGDRVALCIEKNYLMFFDDEDFRITDCHFD